MAFEAAASSYAVASKVAVTVTTRLWRGVAACLCRLGRFPEASEAIAAAAAAAPHCPLVAVSAGDLANARQDPEGALASYQHALSLDPDCVPALVASANTLLQSVRDKLHLARFDCAAKCP